MTQTPTQPEQAVLSGDGAGPEFAMSTWVGEDGDRGQVEILVHTTSEPSIERHASMGLLYGLAILTLEQQGVIAETIEAMLRQGSISEADAVARITLLIKEDANVEPV